MLNACLSGRRVAHDDSLTCIALGTYRAAAGATSMTAGAVPMHFLASCSADCTVKVWSVKDHVVSLQAALELYDLEQPASCCDLLFTHERSTAYCGLLAAGADDGSLVVWAFGSLSTTQLTAAVLFSRKIQTGKERGVLCVKFLTSKRLLVSTKDGGLLCLDMKGGVVMCAIIPAACVLAMEVTCRLDTLVVVAGCSDGGVSP